MPALTKEVFVKKSEDIWGENVWNYGKVVYVDYSTKVILICIEHNLECEQTPHQHLRDKSKGKRNKITACIECDKRKVLEYNTNQTNFIVVEFNELTTKHYDNKSFVEIVCSITGKKSKSVPNNFWDSNDAINCYIKWFVYTFKINTDDDWYKIQAETMNKYGGSGLLAKYNSSLTDLLKYLYPEKEFLPWKFFRCGNKFWGEGKDKPSNIANQQRFIKWLINDMGYDANDFEKYYNITGAMIAEKGAYGLLHYYNDSVIKILEATFPVYKWLPWKFVQVPKSFDWKEKSNCKLWCEWFYSVNNYSSVEDWYKITQELIKEYHGAGLLWHYNGSPSALLSDIYPEYNWIKSKFPVHGYSKASISFLDKLSKSIDTLIQHHSNKGEYRFPEMKRFKADGYIEEYNDYKKIVIEFDGCYYHGCPSCFPDTTIMNKRCKRTFADLHKRSSDKYNKLKEFGYIVIVIKECEHKQIVDMKKWFDENLLASLKPETAI